MVVRLATIADQAAVIALYNTSPLLTVYGPITRIEPRLLRNDAYIVVNDPGGGVLTACIGAFGDDTALQKAVCINILIAATLLPLRAVFKVVAQQARTRGYGLIYGYVSLHPALVQARAYFDTFWNHEDIGVAPDGFRIYQQTPDLVEANA